MSLDGRRPGGDWAPVRCLRCGRAAEHQAGAGIYLCRCTPLAEGGLYVCTDAAVMHSPSGEYREQLCTSYRALLASYTPLGR